MKIVICTMGSRGDVEPYLSLGIELMNLGHEVYISAPAIYRELVGETELKYVEMNSVNPQDMMQIPDIQEAFKSGKMVKSLVLLLKKSKSIIKDFLKEMYKNTQGMDAVITTMILYGAYDGAEKQKVPCLYTLLNPAIPTREFPTVLAPHIPRFLYKMSHKCLDKAFWFCFKKQCNWLRKNEWNLPKLKSCPIDLLKKNKVPILLGYSKEVVPVPADWNESVIVTGYWQRKSKKNYLPNEEVLRFLEASDKPPVYIGFGSMPIGDPEKVVAMLNKALVRSNERAIVYLSYNKNGQYVNNDRVFYTNSISHDWLFPRVRATVIHGGAGTCAASLKAGKPTIVIPFMGDQTFWGERIYKIGAGPKPVLFKDLTAEKLSGLIKEAVTNKSIVENAIRIGEELRSENGSKDAAEIIHSFLHR